MAKKSTKKNIKKNVKKNIKQMKKGMKISAKVKTKVGIKAVAKKKAAAKVKTKVTVEKSKEASSIVGKKINGFAVPVTGGKTFRLNELEGKKVVLYFYPKDMTPGCTIEGHEFTKLKNDFANKNTLVYGVSRDTVESHEKFKEKECYTIDLLSDVDEKLCKAFDVIKDKNMYGKIVRGIERSTFVLDENGTVVKEWRGVKAEGHAQEVLNSI